MSLQRGLLSLAGIAVLFTGGMFALEDPPKEHVNLMNQLKDQMGAIRQGTDVQKNATAMQATLQQTAAWWKSRNSAIANKACTDASAGAAMVAKAASSGDKEGVMAGAKMIGAGCKSCHDQHREKISEDVYKIK